MSATFGNNVQINHSIISLGQNRLMRQQYLDFAVGRNFRKSMLVKAEREEEISISPQLERLREIQFAGRFLPTKLNEKTEEGLKYFLDNRGNELSESNPAMLAVFDALEQAWPRSVSGQALYDLAAAAGEDTPQWTLDKLFYLGKYYICRDEADLPSCLKIPLEPKQLLPGAEDVLRWRREVAPNIGQFNPWHDNASVELSEPSWFVMQQLKNTTKPLELRKLLVEAWQRGMVPDKDGRSLKGHRNLEISADKLIKDLFAMLERLGLLV